MTIYGYTYILIPSLTGFPGYYENFLVCNYGPAANVWKQPVYDIGEIPYA